MTLNSHEAKSSSIAALEFALKEKALQSEDLAQIEDLFDRRVIHDWGICDSFSTRVIRHLITADSSLARRVAAWRNSDYLWKIRASMIPFVVLAKRGDENFKGFMNLQFETCAYCIKNDERFIQLATGWLLRELALADEPRVVQFIRGNITYFSAEGLRYAVEKMAGSLRKTLIDFRKANLGAAVTPPSKLPLEVVPKGTQPKEKKATGIKRARENESHDLAKATKQRKSKKARKV